MRFKNFLIGSSIVALLGTQTVLPSLAATQPSANTKSATVMIALFNQGGTFIGWGSGFYVDAQIIVTNRHVIEDGLYYRVYATGDDDIVDQTCFKNLTRSDVKINLDDDVAYMRAPLSCTHGTMYFAKADPKVGDSLGIIGFPKKSTLQESMHQSITTGTVTGSDSTKAWLTTDAFVDFGNSGGPVVKDDTVVGVVVAKDTDTTGAFVRGLFIPVSQIVRGLTYANDSKFGYIPQTNQNDPAYQISQKTGPMSDADCAIILGEGGQAADDGNCRCASGYHRDNTSMCVATAASSSSSQSSSFSSSSSSRSSSSSSSISSGSSGSSHSSSSSILSSLQMRTCIRVRRWFVGSALIRVNERLQKRLGFSC